MSADKWKIYDEFLEAYGDGTVDLDNDTLKMALFTSSSNAATLTTAGYAALTNEVASANGYTTGGATLGSVTWSQTSGTATLDCADVVWTASGGSITARFAVIYSDTASGKTLIGYSLLDNAPADVTATDGNTLTVAINASGIFTVAANNA